MEDKISVIMSVYKENKEVLGQAIESILNQTFKNIEFIIIIDYPNETWRKEFIENYKDDRIKIFVNEKNIGLPLSLNEGIKYATGNYIARMDADDISIENRLEKQLQFLKKNKLDLCGTNMQCFFDEKKQQLIKFPSLPKNVSRLLREKNCVPHPTWLGNTQMFKELNGYRDIFSCEDYDFLLRANKENYKIANLDEVLFKYRLTQDSISRSNPGKQELIACYLKRNYKNNKVVTLDEINMFINSSKFNKKLKSFNFYCGMKNKRARYRSNKFPKYYIYTILLLMNLRHSIPEIRRKVINSIVLNLDKKGEKIC